MRSINVGDRVKVRGQWVPGHDELQPDDITGIEGVLVRLEGTSGQGVFGSYTPATPILLMPNGFETDRVPLPRIVPADTLDLFDGRLVDAFSVGGWVRDRHGWRKVAP